MSQFSAGLLDTVGSPEKGDRSSLCQAPGGPLCGKLDVSPFSAWSGLAGLLAGLLATVAAVVGWRRLAGALDQPPQAATLCLAGLLVVGLAVSARLARRASLGRPLRPEPLPWRLLTSAAVLVIGGGVMLPGVNPLARAIFWTAILAEEVWAWRSKAEGILANLKSQIPNLRQIQNPKSKIQNRPIPNPPSPFPPDVLQQLTLSRDAEGCQQLSGWLRLPLEAGQRSGNIHVAFCPPFAGVPEIEVEQLAGPQCSIKTAQVLPFGSRLELKLAAPAEGPESVLVRFAARAKRG
ncbi:MAG: hypothetical protein ABR915_23240 [Thermoguttaceae bacterium]|jgi:hypothetical protein